MGSKTRSVEIFRVYNRSGNSQTVELSLITFVRDVTNPSSLLAGFQQVEEMSVDGICVSLETRLGVNVLFFLLKIWSLKNLADDPEEEKMLHAAETDWAERWKKKIF